MVLLGSLEDTQDLAYKLVQLAPPGALLLLAGPLGAGKTALVQALGRALGSDAQISSPTYTLIHEYPTPKGVLVHIDAYRLGDPDALFELGLDDYLDRARLSAIEWGEGLLHVYPDAFVVRLAFEDFEDNVRRAIVTQGEQVLF